MSKYFCNLSLWILTLATVITYRSNYLRTFNRSIHEFLRYKYITVNLCIIRNNKTIRSVLLKCSDNFLNLMLNNSNNLTFSPLTAILLCSYHNLDFIMIESIHRVISLDKYIIFPVRYYYKAKSPACAFKCSNKCYIFRLHILTLL